ncbi:hypothetical protein B0T18DRAFT_192815 [Schizothecium vesticola]|uniref:WSC domain-containing protein n=1 Tax=Schizothecium vesticola TaxID=314040 RepID=A0AA40EQZ1_9PEZI|nr:hypothetical protein B0T18DRAFT_192815 [Schizothecium vesticola]
MISSQVARRWASIAITTLLFSSMVAAEPSISTDYCSSVNTANMEPFLSDYQSQGRCFGNCTDIGAALAIVQWKSCWCSDYIPSPSDQKSLSSCRDPCPGYPDDYCGARGSGGGSFGYMKLKNSAEIAPPGVTNTKTTSVTSLPSVEPGSAVGEPTTTRPPNKGGTMPTAPSVQTVTVGGTVQTVTALPDPNQAGNDQSQLEKSERSGLSTGAMVGIVVGVIGVLAVAGILLFFYCLKRKKNEGEKGFVASRRGSPSGSGGGEVSEARFGDASTLGGWEGSAANSQRRSHLMPVDPRAEFAKGVYARDQNKSQVSIGSLQDNFDYTRPINEVRVLKAMNPDPDP